MDAPRHIVSFGGFTLDSEAEMLTHGQQQVRLRRKSCHVLLCLAERPDTLVSGDELHQRVWRGVAVTPHTLTVVISELRRLLRKYDPSVRIETHYGRGYRLVVDAISTTGAVEVRGGAADPLFVGRDNDLRSLAELWRQARDGRRQIVLVDGLPGVGKTTLVEQFLHRLLHGSDDVEGERFVVRARCSVITGSEAFLSVIEALESCGDEEMILPALRESAPSWLVQLPSLISRDETQALRESLAGSGPTRVRREGVRLFEALASRVPSILVIEDLQWCDASTLEWLIALAERSVEARLLVLATCRSTDSRLAMSPLMAVIARLRRADSFTQLSLGPLGSKAIEEYLHGRLGDADRDPALTTVLEAKSAGNALFLKHALDALIENEWLECKDSRWQLTVEHDAIDAVFPNSLRDLIRGELALLPAKSLEILSAGSVSGLEFNANEVAAALGEPIDTVLEPLSALAGHNHFLRYEGEAILPDGAIVDRYAFRHALYYQAVFDGLTAQRRASFQRRIAEDLEAIYGERVGEIANRLAALCGGAGDRVRHVRYLELAAAHAYQRYAMGDAMRALEEAIVVLEQLPVSVDNANRLSSRWLDYGLVALLIAGFGDARVRRAFDQAWAQAIRAGDVTMIFRAQLGRFIQRLMSGEIEESEQISLALLALATSGHPELRAAAHLYRSYQWHGLGELAAALKELEATFATLPEAAPNIPVDVDLRSAAEVMEALTLASMDDRDLARRKRAAAAQRARRQSSASGRIRNISSLAIAAVATEDARDALTLADEVLEIGERYGLTAYLSLAAACKQWALCYLNGTDPGALEAALRNRHGGEAFSCLLFVRLAELYVERGELSGARRAIVSAERWRSAAFEPGLSRVSASLSRLGN